jgi:hypothetical protein
MAHVSSGVLRLNQNIKGRQPALTPVHFPLNLGCFDEAVEKLPLSASSLQMK